MVFDLGKRDVGFRQFAQELIARQPCKAVADGLVGERAVADASTMLAKRGSLGKSGDPARRRKVSSIPARSGSRSKCLAVFERNTPRARSRDARGQCAAAACRLRH